MLRGNNLQGCIGELIRDASQLQLLIASGNRFTLPLHTKNNATLLRQLWPKKLRHLILHDNSMVVDPNLMFYSLQDMWNLEHVDWQHNLQQQQVAADHFSEPDFSVIYGTFDAEGFYQKACSGCAPRVDCLTRIRDGSPLCGNFNTLKKMEEELESLLQTASSLAGVRVQFLDVKIDGLEYSHAFHRKQTVHPTELTDAHISFRATAKFVGSKRVQKQFLQVLRALRGGAVKFVDPDVQLGIASTSSRGERLLYLGSTKIVDMEAAFGCTPGAIGPLCEYKCMLGWKRKGEHKRLKGLKGNFPRCQVPARRLSGGKCDTSLR